MVLLSIVVLNYCHCAVCVMFVCVCLYAAWNGGPLPWRVLHHLQACQTWTTRNWSNTFFQVHSSQVILDQQLNFEPHAWCDIVCYLSWQWMVWCHFNNKKMWTRQKPKLMTIVCTSKIWENGSISLIIKKYKQDKNQN